MKTMKDNKEEILINSFKKLCPKCESLADIFPNSAVDGLAVLRAMQEYANQERIEGIKEGFEAGRGKLSKDEIMKNLSDNQQFRTMKYATIEDYLNSRKDAKED